MNEMYEKNEILENPVFESYWLSHAKPDTEFEWLKEQKPDFQEDFGRDREIEKSAR